MPNRDPQFDRKLAAIFRAEADEHVRRMQECLARLDASAGAGGEPIEQLFRATHSFKGAARAVGERALESVCHAAETVLAALQGGRIAWSPAIGDALHDVVALLALGLRQPLAPADLAALLPRLQQLEQQAPAPAPAMPLPAAASAPAPAPAQPPAAEPPHTVRVGVERLDRLLFGVEELVGARLNAALRNTQLRDTLASAATLRAAALAAGGELALAWQQHERRLQALAGAGERDTRQFAGTVDTLLADVKKALLLQAGTLRPILAAAVRELARSQGKDVELRLHGAEVEMDRRLLDDLREPLLHLVRNAIAHGIEAPAQRAAAGKPARALLEVGIAARAGGLVEITVTDDGAGIDTGRLAAASRALGLPVPADGGPAELLSLVFGHGVSTASLTEVSGRGIGLPIVRDTVERLGGAVRVHSRPGQGATFTIALTLSLATYRTIEVRAAGRSFLLPAARVDRCLRFSADQLRSVGGHPTVSLGDEELPLVSLAAVLELPASAVPAPAPNGHCVVVGDSPRRIALAVDAIGGEQEVLGKPVEAGLTRSPVLSAVASLAAGQLAPILNVPELVRIVQRGGRQLAPAPVAARQRGSAVLLAEDSITSRTLLKNILELAGHRVEVAVDGVDALRKLRAGHFDVLVSDVEMPNLDGIALTQAVRGDAALAELPVVLVTSLASPRDRERGAEAGANAYIVKSSFDQGDLLQAIAELA